MSGSWISLLPFLIVIPVALFTKQVQPGLFVALLLGSYLIDPHLLGGVTTALEYLIKNIVQANNIKIILFLYGFAGLVQLMKTTGGIKGFVEWVSTKVKTKKGAMFLTWISTLGTFSDPDFRIVTIAPIMKAMQQRLGMSKKRVGIAIEVTSNPIVALIPIATGFVGFMVTTIDHSLKNAGIDRHAYRTYIESIPFNFFSIVIIVVGLIYTFFLIPKKEKEQSAADADKQNQVDDGVLSVSADMSPEEQLREIGSSLKGWQNALNKLSGLPENKYAMEEYSKELDAATLPSAHANRKQGEEIEQQDRKSQQEENEKTPSKPWNLLLPLLTVLLLTLFLSWWDGHAKAGSFMGAFLKINALDVLLQSLLITLILSLVFYMFQKFSVAKLTTHFIKGGNNLMSVIVLLALIWAVSAISEDLGFSAYITDHVKNVIPDSLIAPSLFLLGAVISYVIGSSWGTWGLLMPLGIMLAASSGANILLVIGAVFASGTFGAFASPLSDNTVTLCTILGLPVIKYAKAKLPIALISGAITLVLFVIASFIF